MDAEKIWWKKTIKIEINKVIEVVVIVIIFVYKYYEIYLYIDILNIYIIIF